VAPASVPNVAGEGELAPLPPPPAPAVNPVEPIAPADPIAAPKSNGGVYKVKKGDSLSLIAFKHGVSVRELAAANNLSGKAMNNLRVGQELVIPDGAVYNPDRKMPRRAKDGKRSAAKKSTGKNTAAKAAPALGADGMYVVKSGDSLDRIGRRYGVTAAAIAKENNIALNKVLQIGDKLRIPGKSVSAAGNRAPSAPVPAAAPANTATLGDELNTDLGLSDVSSSAAADNSPAAPAAQPAAAPAATAATDSIEVPTDTTVEEYSKQIMVPVDELRRLNPNIPADGKLKGGSYVVIPRL
jgi:LysM repeat protein